MTQEQDNVFIAAEIFPPQIGGPATYALKIANEFSRQGLGIRVLCYGKPDKSQTTGLYQVYSVAKKWPREWRYFIYFLKLLFYSINFKVIYAQGPVAAGLPAVIGGKILGKKVVVKVVGDYAWEQSTLDQDNMLPIDEFQKGSLNLEGKYKMINQIQRWVVKKADLVIVPSNYLKNIVSGWGVAEENIIVIYNAVESCHETIMAPSEAQKKINLFGDIILTVGRLVPWKGIDLLMDLMPELIKINPDFKLIVVGSGPDKGKLIAHSQNLKITNSVIFTGKLDKETLRYYFRAASCFVLNSGYEGLPHSILEAFCLKCPVIASSIGGIPELIKYDWNGILVGWNNRESIKEAIIKLWQDKEFAQKLTDNAYQFLTEQFDYYQMIEETKKILIGERV